MCICANSKYQILRFKIISVTWEVRFQTKNLKRGEKMEAEAQNTSEISATKGRGFVFVCEDEALKYNGVELPTEQDGTLMLSVLRSQFEGATGLKYRSVWL